MAVIGLDARMAGPIPSGLGTYATQLTRALLEADRVNDYVVIAAPGSRQLFAAAANLRIVEMAGDLDTPRNLLHGPALSRLALDLYHSLHHFVPPWLTVRHVVLTLHDLIWIEHPRLIKGGRFGPIHSLATHLFARPAMRHAIRRASAIVAGSADARARAIAYYGLAPERIHHVPHGVDPAAFPFAAGPPASPPYFLVIGNTRPYKNVATAIRAFALCAPRRRNLRLIVAGRGDAFRDLEALARSLDVADHIRFEPRIAPVALIHRLHEATALLFPSLVEGFGFPVLEAMSAGCPVIASRAASVTEVAEGAALLCEANDAGAFAAAMQRLLDDPQLIDQLRARGRERAAAFTWEHSAAATLGVYRQLLC
jgi:glycosyltransferase involved in cell wall biosynthesis